jgi:uncharacterized membrane protein
VTQTPSQAPSVPKRRWLLLASLALNMLFVGTIGGAVLARHRLGPPPEFAIGKLAGEPGLRAFFRALPKDRRPVFRPLGEQFRTTVKPLRLAVRQARDLAAAALVAEPFDPARFENATNELIAAETAARRATASIVASTLTIMTPQERGQFHAYRKSAARKGQGGSPDDAPEFPVTAEPPPASPGSPTSPRTDAPR